MRSFSLAGFEVTLNGRFWVTPEGKTLTFDFGVLMGWLIGSPRLGAQIGFSFDF